MFLGTGFLEKCKSFNAPVATKLLASDRVSTCQNLQKHPTSKFCQVSREISRVHLVQHSTTIFMKFHVHFQHDKFQNDFREMCAYTLPQRSSRWGGGGAGGGLRLVSECVRVPLREGGIWEEARASELSLSSLCHSEDCGVS